MAATKIYEGTGSAIDDYFAPKKTQSRSVGTKSENWAFFDKNNQQHSYIRSLCMQAQWTVPNGKWGEVADLDRLSDFLKSDKSPVKKPLKKMVPEEVSKIIIALEGIVGSTFKKKK